MTLLLVINAVAGTTVLRVGMQQDDECYHIWGTTLEPKYSKINFDSCFQ